MTVSAEAIEQYLPQLQCGLCGYGGCEPYAKALAKGETTLNRCLPGGDRVIGFLANLLGQAIEPLAGPSFEAHRVVIDESACIGCTKCLAVCPVDAIVGAKKQMHTVLIGDCTGCDLCLPVCPMDCIDKVETTPVDSDTDFFTRASQAKAKYLGHQQRIGNATPTRETLHQTVVDKKQFLADILARKQKNKGKEDGC